MPTARMPQAAIKTLERAIKAADMANSNCGVEDEHKKAMKLYLDCWVNGPLEALLAWGKGADGIDKCQTWAKHR